VNDIDESLNSIFLKLLDNLLLIVDLQFLKMHQSDCSIRLSCGVADCSIRVQYCPVRDALAPYLYCLYLISFWI